MKIAKLAISLLVISNLSINLVANDSYIIEAEGEFGKELKALVEKHAKDSNLSVKIHQNNQKVQNDESDDRFLNIGVNKNATYNSIKGKELYEKNCKACHGDNGTKRAMGVSERLSDMSGDDIADSMAGYRGDAQYGGRLKYLMAPIAVRMSLSDLGHIIAYLKGDNAFAISEDENENIKTTPTKQGSYLE